MARAGRVCNVPGCPASPAPHSGRCAEHTPTTTERHYGAEHQARRAQLLPKAYGTVCPLGCGTLMFPGQELDLCHPPGSPLRQDPTSVGDRIGHAVCPGGGGNRADTKTRLPEPSWT